MIAGDPARSALLQRLENLRASFVRRTGEDIETLRVSVANMREGAGTSAAARESIRRVAHSLTGAGGTLGFPHISGIAAKLEDFYDTAPDDEALIVQTNETIAKLSHEVEVQTSARADVASSPSS